MRGTARRLVTGIGLSLLLGAAAVPVGGQESANPHGALPESLDCSACHTATAWSPARASMEFQHGAESGFTLSGAHETVACAGCHLDLRFDGPSVDPVDCASCHVDVHQGGMLPTCADCHDTSSFRVEDGEGVHARTSFPLTGAHLQVTCESCHTSEQGGAYAGADPECVACHQEDYRSAQTVDHEAAGYPTDCTECHSTVAWSDAPLFDHAAVSSGFQLVGAHDALRCASCHTLPEMTVHWDPSGSQDCVACHRADYDEEHGGSEFPTTCLDCHTVDTWDDADFDHALTGFALVGAHRTMECASCHIDDDRALRFPEPSGQADCAACHQSDYDSEHAGSGFPTTCLECHTVDTWDDADFDHATTGFALVGAHQGMGCTSCHTEDGSGLHFPEPSGQNDCAACHQADYDGEHAGSGFPTTCLECHTTNTWEGATFDHAAMTGFVLEGAHAAASCRTCHDASGALVFPEPSGQNDCAACHQADYEGEHAGSGFPTTCLECHTVDTWDDADFDHATTGFALVGAHGSTSCQACHDASGGLVFPEPSGQNDCAACHQSDYDAQHAGSGFPTTCLECHTTNTWEGATFDHATTGFRLVGSHQGMSCTSCHTGSSGGPLVFPEPSGQNDCAACHQSDYDAQHAGSGFPTTCLECHTTNTWEGATFDHATTGFRLVGSHQGMSCTSCHTGSSGGPLVFPEPSGQNDCAACHQSDYDAQHAGSGFPTTCLECHTTNTWEGATFDHGAVAGFTLAGAHAATECTSCHALPDYVLLFPPPADPQDCVACHRPDYDREHAGSGYPTTCATCHGQSNWSAAFDHDAQFFPIDRGEHREAWSTCMDCHPAAGDFSVFTCISCHEHNRSSTDDDHREVSDYVYESGACLSCHPRGDS